MDDKTTDQSDLKRMEKLVGRGHEMRVLQSQTTSPKSIFVWNASRRAPLEKWRMSLARALNGWKEI
ncbi:MAG: hypothetical protein NTAFB01_17700 [Nitrospira sp.]